MNQQQENNTNQYYSRRMNPEDESERPYQPPRLQYLSEGLHFGEHPQFTPG
jgi:hypothetical protein